MNLKLKRKFCFKNVYRSANAVILVFTPSTQMSLKGDQFVHNWNTFFPTMNLSIRFLQTFANPFQVCTS